MLLITLRLWSIRHLLKKCLCWLFDTTKYSLHSSKNSALNCFSCNIKYSLYFLKKYFYLLSIIPWYLKRRKNDYTIFHFLVFHYSCASIFSHYMILINFCLRGNIKTFEDQEEIDVIEFFLWKSHPAKASLIYPVSHC